MDLSKRHKGKKNRGGEQRAIDAGVKAGIALVEKYAREEPKTLRLTRSAAEWDEEGRGTVAHDKQSPTIPKADVDAFYRAYGAAAEKRASELKLPAPAATALPCGCKAHGKFKEEAGLRRIIDAGNKATRPTDYKRDLAALVTELQAAYAEMGEKGKGTMAMFRKKLDDLFWREAEAQAASGRGPRTDEAKIAGILHGARRGIVEEAQHQFKSGEDKLGELKTWEEKEKARRAAVKAKGAAPAPVGTTKLPPGKLSTTAQKELAEARKRGGGPKKDKSETASLHGLAKGMADAALHDQIASLASSADEADTLGKPDLARRLRAERAVFETEHAKRHKDKAS